VKAVGGLFGWSEIFAPPKREAASDLTFAVPAYQSEGPLAPKPSVGIWSQARDAPAKNAAVGEPNQAE